MAEPWPPAPGPGDRYDEKRLVDRSGPPWVPCRLVRLWGADVWLHDESGRVWCRCLALVDVADLARADNPHAVGLPYRATGRLLPMGDDDRPPATSSRWSW